MKDIYIHQACFEKCKPTKPKTDVFLFYNALHYIVEGYGYFNGVRLGKGQYFFALENQRACWYPDTENPWSYYYFDIYGADAANLIKEHTFYNNNSYGNFQFFDEIALIVSLINTYYSHNKINDSFLPSVAISLLSLHQKTDDSIHMTEAEKHVKKIKDYIDHNFNQKIKIEDIASKMYLSRAYVRNIFFEHMNLSPKEYLQKVRLEAAKSLLSNTKHSISLISKSVGYDDQLAFSKIFKKTYGLSPLDFRKLSNTIMHD